MTFSHSAHGPHLVLILEGNLHGQEHHSVVDEITSEHLENQSGNLILDCTALNHINSTGLNMLLKLLNAYKTNDRQVFIAGANTSVKGVLAITKLNTIFGLTENVEAALANKNRQTTPNS